ncbi:MAG: hypothetical protein QW324_05130 [Thermofilaceae archaeon]
MKRLVPALMATLLLAGVLLLSLALSQEATVEWIASLQPNPVYIDQPATLKVYAHVPNLQLLLPVSCNVTVTNETDVVLYDRISGAPAVGTYSFNAEASYLFRVYCITLEEPESYAEFSYTLTIVYPEPDVRVSTPRWMRPLVLEVVAPYPYTGYPVLVEYAGSTYTEAMVSGRAVFTLPPIARPETVRVVFLGREKQLSVDPVPPVLDVQAPSSVKVGSSFTVVARLFDDVGALDVPAEVSMVFTGPCEPPSPPYYVNTEYTVAVPFNASSGFCTVTATVELWSGMTLESWASVAVLTPLILSAELVVSNTTSWNYAVQARVELDAEAWGRLTVYVNGEEVAASEGVQRAFEALYSATLTPGRYTVSAWFHYSEGALLIREVEVLVPRYPYTIQPPPPIVHAGEAIVVPNADHYAVYLNESAVLVVAFYPGDELHEPATAAFVVRVLHPVIELTEHAVRVSNGAPGASLRVYCSLGDREVVLADATVPQSGSLYLSFTGRATADCEKLYAVYRYGSYVSVVPAGAYEPVVVLSTRCYAGLNCTLLAPSPRIRFAEVAGAPYEPGTAVRLPPGVYALRVHTTYGKVLEFHVVVEELAPVTVEALYRDGAWYTSIRGPPWAVVRVVLATGLVVELPVGVHRLHAEPVSAYWGYGRCVFVKYALVHP